MKTTIRLLPGETIAEALVRYQLANPVDTEKEAIVIPAGTSIIGDHTIKTIIIERRSTGIPFLVTKTQST